MLLISKLLEDSISYEESLRGNNNENFLLIFVSIFVSVPYCLITAAEIN